MTPDFPAGAPAPEMMPAPGGARWCACLRDYLAIAGWIMAVTAAGTLVRAWWSVDISSVPLVVTDMVIFGSTVLPLWIYLSLTEAGAHQAGWGKRGARLRVVATPTRLRAGPIRAGLRNGVKLLPWQLAHIAVVRATLSVDAPALIDTTLAFSLAIPATSLLVAWRDPQHRALHDLIASTRVVWEPESISTREGQI